jgi:hypothetical protein
MSQPADDAKFVIPLPGGRVARVPLSVLERHLDPDAHPVHDASGGAGQVEAQEMSQDATTGQAFWHTDWEMGACTYNDDSGFPIAGYCWHRHPLGNSYTEIMQ